MTARLQPFPAFPAERAPILLALASARLESAPFLTASPRSGEAFALPIAGLSLGPEEGAGRIGLAGIVLGPERMLPGQLGWQAGRG
ncbi:hypothetical protein [Rhabdaerophilum sp. SD176]|uniref:hypothetical protein n=1 Tax=Rhabdaerophilum sp. SD176 TaxID=2983548 RepID=UPI0024DFA88B|nr:hypothetical protein [Rhabdaerophilum sp. SD176]